MTKETKTIYRLRDGTEFDNEKDAKLHTLRIFNQGFDAMAEDLHNIFSGRNFSSLEMKQFLLGRVDLMRFAIAALDDRAVYDKPRTND